MGGSQETGTYAHPAEPDSLPDFKTPGHKCLVCGKSDCVAGHSPKPLRPLTYLASPYSHTSPIIMEARYQAVTRAAAYLIRHEGWNVFAPITHSHPLATIGGLQGNWDYWKALDEGYISVSERLVVLELPGWRDSVGVQAEIKLAERYGIPVCYLLDSLDSGKFDIAPQPHRTIEGDHFMTLALKELPSQSWPENDKRAEFTPTPGAPPPYDPVALAATPITMACNKPWLGDVLRKVREDNGTLRRFETGATRDSEEGKYDYEGFFSPLTFEAYGAYMHKHRKQSDGQLRDSDNWQKGIPRAAYVKSLFRHFVQLWKLHRGLEAKDEKGNAVTFEDACCAIVFNALGYLHEHQQKR